jgi:hypothetical protein
MARGSKLSLLETTAPEDIIMTNEEVGSIPFFLIDDDYGISGCYADLALVVKKRANKTGKEENGEDPTKVYSFYRWDELKYDSKISGIYECYYKIKELAGFKKIRKSTNLNDLIKIQEEIKVTIHRSLDITENNQITQVYDLLDTVAYLKNQITEGKKVLTELNQTCSDTIDELKKSRKIIVENMPKQKKQKEVQEETV